MVLSTRTAPEDLVRKITPRTLFADPPSVLQGTDLPSLFPEQAVSGHPHQGRPDAFVEPQLPDRRLSPRCRAQQCRSRARLLPTPQCGPPWSRLETAAVVAHTFGVLASRPCHSV